MTLRYLPRTVRRTYIRRAPPKLAEVPRSLALILLLAVSILVLPVGGAKAWGPDGPPPCNPGDRWKDPSDGKLKAKAKGSRQN